MRIGKLISELQRMKDIYGDIHVESRSLHGEFSKSIRVIGCEAGISIESFFISQDDEDEVDAS